MNRTLAAPILVLSLVTARGLLAAPPAAASVDTPEARAFFEGWFPWGPGEVKVAPMPTLKGVPGYQLVRATKTFKLAEPVTDQIEAALDDAGRLAIVGPLFVDEERMGSADLARTTDLLRKRVFGPMSFSVAFDPASDLKGWKGLTLTVDTGLGSYHGPALLSENGAYVFVGRTWDRHRPMAEQRRERLHVESTPSEGESGARVTVVEFSDMQCPSCKKRSADWEALRAKLAPVLPIRRYFKSYPLTSIHQWAFRASSAGRCFFDKEPSLFLRWKAAVYAKQEELTVDTLDLLAFEFSSKNGIPTEDLARCYLQGASKQHVLDDLTEGFSMGVRSTPTFYVDGVQVTWHGEDTMEEFLRTKYLNGAGLPLKKAAPPATKAAPTKAPSK